MSLAAVNVDSTKGRRIRSRKDADKQEAVIKMSEVKDKIDYLLQLYKASEDAGNTYGEAVKSIAEKAGLQSSVVRKFVSARASEKFDDKKRDCEQLQLCFDKIGG